VRLGELLRRSDASRAIQSDETYNEITVRLWGRGVVLRRRAAGAEIASPRRFVARTDQLILSRIDARHGAIGVVPDALDGGVVSNDFPLFDIDATRVLPRFVEWLTKTASFVDLCRSASEGTTNRVRLQEDRFLRLDVALPPLPEQRRIVAKLDLLSAKVEEARALRAKGIEESKLILSSAIDESIGSNWPVVRLEEAVDPERPITYGIVQAGPHVPDGVPYIRVSDMARSTLSLYGMLRTSPEVAARYRRSAVKSGDLVFAIRATVGKVRQVPAELDGANLTQGTARIAPSRSVTGPYLFWTLQSRSVTDAIHDATKGSTFKEITLGRLRSIPVPVPPVAAQDVIVARVGGVASRVDEVARHLGKTSAELEALMPAILDRAFNGEL